MTTSKSSDKNQLRSGELFLVATPIGNLKDITLRAIEVLENVDRIACEDTRTSGVLLKHYGIKTPMKAYHTHNEAEAAEQLVAELSSGKRIALISDAGTPLLSDPGARLVSACIAAGIRVTPIPGASALLSALSVAGMPAEQFFYAGFLPNKSGARKEILKTFTHLQCTLVFYEAPHRLLDSLADMREVFGERDGAVARELTKLHEECVRGSLSDIITHFEAHAPRGECVILVHGAAPAAAMDDAAIDNALREAMKDSSLKEAVATVAEHAGRAKSDVYARALALKRQQVTSTAQRQRSQRHGIFAEYAALAYLTLKGYRFVTGRYKTKFGEIDLIVRRGKTLVFVEVKARATHDIAAHAVHAKNQSRVVQAAQMFLVAHPAYQEYQVRFDVVLIAWYSRPHHLVNAFAAH